MDGWQMKAQIVIYLPLQLEIAVLRAELAEMAETQTTSTSFDFVIYFLGETVSFIISTMNFCLFLSIR
jgi:hypothetical protein